MGKKPEEQKTISRRNFFKFSGAAIAGSTINFLPFNRARTQDKQEEGAKVKKFRILGRTGFKVGDISMGTTRVRDANIVRYAYDKGVNYFDTGETYGNGMAERFIGEMLKYMDRKKIFITTKIHLRDNESEESIMDRFKNCLGRLQTDYIDAFYMHGVTDVNMLNHAAFHEVATRLKSEGKMRFIGLSSHGPRGNEGDSMEKVMCAAAEDGRFDLMLFIYNFMNKESGDKILAACKKKNVGTTAMKTSPGVLAVDPIDPENLTEDQERYVNRIMDRGSSREQALERLKSRTKSQQESYEKTKPFIEKYNVKTADDLRKISIHWVVQNEDMHTTCVSFADFDLVDRIIPISGTKLSQAEMKFLEEYKLAFENQYCRHGCNACTAACRLKLPVSTIMRYAYYYETQGREKDAMQKYANLRVRNASNCAGCDAPCLGNCPFGVDIQSQLVQAHSMLTFV